MSNKNNKDANRKRLAEKQRLKDKKLLLQIEEEIKKLEYQIKHSRVTNTKINAIKILKISLRFIQLITPYVVAFGIALGGFCAFRGTPFYRDKHKQSLQMMKEIDNYGHVRYEQQYAKYDAKNTISYYGKWEDVGNGFYSRDVEIYLLGSITEEAIMKLINEDSVSSLESVLGEPISKKKETSNNLTEEELNSNALIQALIYSELEDDYIMVKESVDDNIGITLLWIIATIVIELLALTYRMVGSNFDFEYCIREIKRKYPTVNIEELTKKLEIKRNNYDRLTRK